MIVSKFKPQYSNQFKKDYKLMQKRGYDLTKLDTLLNLILEGDKLPPVYRDHSLEGQWKGCRDAHVAFDWILIYEYVDAEESVEKKIVKLWRTGTHSDLSL